MLVITRKEGESLLIGENIEINISKIIDGNVKIAINAPKEMIILRKELVTEIKNENKIAAKVDLNLLKNLKK
jgi:carbon storage regulator